MIKSTNYVAIQGWMCKNLKLKGNSLIIYSVIYGFCQDRTSWYHGSLEYLEQWTNCTRQGVIKVLKELVDKGYILKESNFPNNNYYINFDYVDKTDEDDDVKNIYYDVNKVNTQVNKVNNESKQSLQNNIENNKVNNIDIDNTVDEIISYLNKVCSTNYRKTSSTVKLINLKLKSGFTVEDFKTVIDYKFAEWGVKPIKFSTGQMSTNYLRPSTLFGQKMADYLNQANNCKAPADCVSCVEKLPERSTKKY